MKTIDWSSMTPKEVYSVYKTMPTIAHSWMVSEGHGELPDIHYRSLVGREVDIDLVHDDDGWHCEVHDEVLLFTKADLSVEEARALVDNALKAKGYVLLSDSDIRGA